MDTESMRLCGLAVAAAVTLGGTQAHSAAVYDYKGKPYTYNYPTNGCLKLTMHLSMTIVFKSALAANLSNTVVPAVSWVIDDGLHKFKDTEAKAIVKLNPTFSTDKNGIITAWSVNATYYSSNGIDVLYATHSSTGGGDYSDDAKCTTAAIASNFTPGNWVLK